MAPSRVVMTYESCTCGLYRLQRMKQGLIFMHDNCSSVTTELEQSTINGLQSNLLAMLPEDLFGVLFGFFRRIRVMQRTVISRLITASTHALYPPRTWCSCRLSSADGWTVSAP